MNTSTTEIIFAEKTYTTANGIKMQDLAYNNKKLIMQTPKMLAPFGISNQFKSECKFEINLRFEENNALHEQFQRMIKAIEKIVIQYIFQHQEILGVSGKSFEIIADKFSSCIKENKKYGKSIVPKLETTKAKFFDSNQVQVEKVNEKSVNHALIEIPSIWITSGRFGMKMKCIQIQTFDSEENKISSFAFVNMDE